MLSLSLGCHLAYPLLGQWQLGMGNLPNFFSPPAAVKPSPFNYVVFLFPFPLVAFAVVLVNEGLPCGVFFGKSSKAVFFVLPTPLSRALLPCRRSFKEFFWRLIRMWLDANFIFPPFILKDFSILPPFFPMSSFSVTPSNLTVLMDDNAPALGYASPGAALPLPPLSLISGRRLPLSCLWKPSLHSLLVFSSLAPSPVPLIDP